MDSPSPFLYLFVSPDQSTLMQNQNVSPPVEMEKRLFNAPDLQPDDWGDVIFTFHFEIADTPKKPQVSFTLTLNPDLQNADQPQQSPPEPTVYTFENDVCKFVHSTPENYYMKGTITIIYFNSPVGSFYNDMCNFNFDIEFGKIEEPSHTLLGVYQLIDPDNPPS